VVSPFSVNNGDGRDILPKYRCENMKVNFWVEYLLYEYSDWHDSYIVGKVFVYKTLFDASKFSRKVSDPVLPKLGPTSKNSPMSWFLHFFHSKSNKMDENKYIDPIRINELSFLVSILYFSSKIQCKPLRSRKHIKVKMLEVKFVSIFLAHLLRSIFF